MICGFLDHSEFSDVGFWIGHNIEVNTLKLQNGKFRVVIVQGGYEIY